MFTRYNVWRGEITGFSVGITRCLSRVENAVEVYVRFRDSNGDLGAL